MIKNTAETTGYIIALVFVFMIGVFTISGAGSIGGLNGCLPQKYIGISRVGCSSGALLINILRMIFLAIFPLNEQGLNMSAQLYFVFVALMLCVSAF